MKKKLSKTYIYALTITFTTLYIYFGYLIYSYIFFYPSYTLDRGNILEANTFDIKSKERLASPLEILPTNYEDLIVKNKLTITQEERSHLLNNGYSFSPINAEGPIDLFSSFSTLAQNNDNNIFISSDILSYYFQFNYEEIKNSIIQDKLQIPLDKLIKDVNRRIIFVKFNPLFNKSAIDSLLVKLNNAKDSLKNDTYYNTIVIINSMNEEERNIFLKIVRKLKLQNKLEYINSTNQLLGFTMIFSEDNEPTITDSSYSSSIYIKPSEDRVIDENIKITVEKDMQNYEYIRDYLKDISSTLPEFDDLENDIQSILIYLNKQTNNEDTSNEKKIIMEILTHLPNIDISMEQEKKLGYLISALDNSLNITPYIETLSLIDNIDNENFSKEYDITPALQPKDSVRIPVFMYHQIDYAPIGSNSFKQGLYMSPELFEKQIAYLTKKNYKSVTSEEFLELLKQGKNPTQKTVMLTFDDAVGNHYSVAYPILKKYGQTGVFFVTSNRSVITANQLKEMSDNGMDIQSHSATHPDLTKVSDISILQGEIGGSRATLQSITGKNINSIAYPGCVANTQVYNIVASSGYSLGFSCGRTIDHYYSNRLSLARVHTPNDLTGFMQVLSGIN